MPSSASWNLVHALDGKITSVKTGLTFEAATALADRIQKLVDQHESWIYDIGGEVGCYEADRCFEELQAIVPGLGAGDEPVYSIVNPELV